MEPKSKLSGPDRAAVFLMSLGEEAAAEVLRHMGPKEVQSVGTAMASLTNVSKSDVAQVIDDFVATVDEQTALGMGSDDYIRNVLTWALGKDKADGVIDRILLGRNSKGLESLKWMDPRAVAEVIRLEHPQIIAIVLSYLDPDHAAAVLSFLPERTQPDILMRIATLDGVQPSALQELDEILERQFAGNMNVKSSSVGGVKSAATILNFMDSSKEGSILDKVRDVDESLSQKIQDLMFVFANLADLDDRSIQSLLRELSTDSLVMALKGADETVKDRIFKNMSKRAGEMLQDDLEAKGPVRLSEVEAAQKEILGIARRMAESGEIVLGNKGSEQMV
ncbi:flagellar motor switch protein FliG [Ectothiorhodospira haloalkaliphila]|uniref:Flagellar motor switch protein FliG n=1 Tax=Ectothiorhodospira haloalkaliphila TaxID=421628 RepID=W8KV03_9GAMM|nr:MULTISPECIES: flagellar motor switch protein FliG [Ectothiorhodospira]AHK79416.1 flagellar motor switch protein FliG [Ectothiorhodospira haloalkaliphila]MCG5494065.1 flagellar motor switch protein FliG [Ectothiorhodospira variabilis]MCG5498002.1 flagellar motor switch protein FliG [Ectothiorhodospira variabilis]MCG5503405.1 flagellar motor switch protein FliG [Ectothiorhodospira variabilis]MCG5506507.1 flagellar motor switch protein FliG [Ectothiorhodospira variabilis]